MSLLRLLLAAVLPAGCALVDGDRRFDMSFPGAGDGPPAAASVQFERIVD